MKQIIVIVSVALVGVCFAPPIAANSSATLPAIVDLLLSDQDTQPIVLHPGAGEHTAVPLSDEPGALPFGLYRYLPTDFTLDKRKNFPLLVFLHGQGELGNGTSQLNKVLVNGPPKMIENGVDFPAVVVSPQLANGNWQVQRNGVDVPADLHALVAYFKDNFNVDPRRIYFTGLSLGGGGAWNYTRLYSDEVAAVVPICGIGTSGQMINTLASLGVWAFHSVGDTQVSSRETIRQMNLIGGTQLDGPDGVMSTYPDDGQDNVVSLVDGAWQWRAGRYDAQGNTRFTMFPDNSHNSWARAYNQNGGLDTPMWEWLFAQQRSD